MALGVIEKLRRRPRALLPAPGTFLNREKQLEAVELQLGRLRKAQGHFKVCKIEGQGGIGKSRLLDELRTKAERGSPRFNHIAFVSLETEAAMTEVGPLLALRQGLDVGCHLFDAALLRYWSAAGQPFSAERSSRLGRSLAVKTAEIGGSFAPIPLPFTFAIEVWERVGEWGERQQRYDKWEFQEIDDLRAEPSSIRERLPSLLARDLSKTLKDNSQSIVVFYDSYEKQDRETYLAGAPWLQTFIGELGRGVHVICSREPYRKWKDVQWGDDSVTVTVGPLPKKNAEQMVQVGLGELSSEEIKARVLKVSKRNPLLIESLVSVCVELASENGEIAVDDIPSSPKGAVKGLLDHHRAPQRALAAALATVQIFDRKLYEHIAYVLSVELAVLHYEDFVDSFVIEPSSDGLHKTHDLLTDVVRGSDDEANLRSVALEATTKHLLTRSRKDGRREHRAMLAMLRKVIAGWDSVEEMPEHCVEALIDVVYVFHDAGFWNELASIASSARASQPAISTTVAFVRALTSRRRVGVQRALTRFEEIDSSKRRLLGRHERSIELELAYLRELRGNYPAARDQFEQLSEQAKPFDPRDRTQLRARLYHADMLTMDGHFRKGSSVLEEAYEAIGYREIVNWGELVRHDGHNYRFSFMLEEAVGRYELALERTGEAPGMTAKLHTNLAEAYCWFEPERALEKGKISLEAHQRGGNEIELCKCQAARGIALARLERFKEAAEAITEAKRFGKSSRYPAGVAFAMQAELVGKALGGGEAFAATPGLLKRKVEGIGTYGHLRVVPLLLRGDDAFAATATEYEWFDPEGLEARLRGYLGI